MSTVSIITVAMPGRGVLAHQLVKSLLAQEHTVGVTWIIATERRSDFGNLAKKVTDPSIKVVYAPVSNDSSIAAKRNAALALADSEFVLNLDDDDFLYGTTAIADLTQKFTPEVVAVIGKSCDYLPNANQFKSWDQAPAGKYQAGYQGTAARAVTEGPTHMAVHTSAAMWRTELAKQAGGWDEALEIGEDISLLLKYLSTTEGDVIITDDVVHAYRKHPGSIMRQAGSAEKDRMIVPMLYEAHGLGDQYVAK